ncbi:N,N'-diacetylbacillosaminyl-diphospho-undecaprenol alpha-1,3-N-acetylgalactosaminyltransferase [Pseudodesulfovibrio hydrargyri]|uniref:N, N'-diacetylbacillosaminyl-diphospho-undecaprenol alpha-1,3-N-acetylgalactosaminyltransferase n=1 Tax=Pseudodesulfovibrio hydrargyri TaxID=2125990 RepID=A0A1J5N2X8_9BACT|nr:glycosyltransferase [Pseudodesulfovibrio hydrargyri]OIQ49979.1 N,N'-diacetylbacillosaminyl-diphospho-undecaprenol alpha-1,3-N-acetylgalactosaminyltransferase [Pseudodesulfovibrio hydrargyri]
MKIAVIHESAETLLAEYGSLLTAMVSMGHAVNALAPGSGPDAAAGFEALGAEYAMYPLSSRGLTPVGDLGTLLHLKQVLYRVRPDLILSMASKPVIYGSLAARMAWVGEEKTVFALVDGPGFAFGGNGLKGRLLARLARPMFRAGFRSCDGICFRSAEAETFFRELGVLGPEARTGIVDQADTDARDRAVLAFLGMIPAD